MKTFVMTMLISFMLLLACGYGIAADDTTFAGYNLNGDLAYLNKSGACLGVGADLVNYKDGLVTLRAEALWPKNAERAASNVIGAAAVTVDVVRLVTASGATWSYGIIQPKLGPLAGFNLAAKRWEYGGLLQVIRKTF